MSKFVFAILHSFYSDIVTLVHKNTSRLANEIICYFVNIVLVRILFWRIKMTYRFENLDQTTRNYMIEEFRRDIETGNQYISPRIKSGFASRYLTLFGQVITEGRNEDDFASDIKRFGYLITEEPRRTKSGITMAKVPERAAETLAHGEFNRYYMRGLCRRALDENLTLVIYRAKQVSKPSEISQQIIGKSARPQVLLEILRDFEAADERFPDSIEINIGGPNSGLSVRIQ